MGKTFQLFFMGAAFAAAVLPAENRSHTELRFLDRRRKRTI